MEAHVLVLVQEAVEEGDGRKGMDHGWYARGAGVEYIRVLEAVAAARALEELVGETDVAAHGADGSGAAGHGDVERDGPRPEADQEYQGVQKMGRGGGGVGWKCRGEREGRVLNRNEIGRAHV